MPGLSLAAHTMANNKRKRTTKKNIGTGSNKRKKVDEYDRKRMEDKDDMVNESGESEDEAQEETEMAPIAIKSQKGVYGLQWYQVGDSLYFLDSKNCKPSKKIFGFDLVLLFAPNLMMTLGKNSHFA